MFLSAYSALEWAYNTIERPIVKLSGINQMRREPSRGIRNGLLTGLTVQERHKQAANIIGMVGRLEDPAAQEYIAAKFGNRHQKEDIKILVFRGCDAIGVGLSGQSAVYKIMKGYFDGRESSYRDARRVLKCRDQQAIMAKKCLYDVLDIIEHHAMAEISVIFEEHGLIVSSVRQYSN
jgi:hypothetical protein